MKAATSSRKPSSPIPRQEVAMEFLKKFGSRKLIVTFIFGIGVPTLFSILHISEQITMFGMGLGAAYLGANAVAKGKE